MAAPTQVFPPWLTQLVTTITDSDGTPLTTETSVAYLPLTYFGPSVSTLLSDCGAQLGVVSVSWRGMH